MHLKTILTTFFISVFLGLSSFCENTSPNIDKDGDIRERYKKFKDHHLMDNHMFVLTHDISFPLPVIIYADGKFDVFMSSNLYDNHHHPVVYEINGRAYKVDEHEHIKEVGSGLSLVDFSITKNVVFILICFVLMILMFGKMAKSYKHNPLPKGIGRLLEPIIIYIRDDIRG